MDKKGKLIFVLWVSWAWKNTILQLLVQRHPELHQIISCKTRPLRPNEINGKDYHYMTNEIFLQEIKNWTFLEYAVLHGWQFYYGTRKKDIIEWLSEGHILIKEIDMQGIEKLAHDEHDLFESSLRIFLDLSEESMIRRITSRAPISNEELHRRLQSAHQERLMAKQYASVILSAEWTIEDVYASVNSHVVTYLHQ